MSRMRLSSRNVTFRPGLADLPLNSVWHDVLLSQNGVFEAQIRTGVAFERKQRFNRLLVIRLGGPELRDSKTETPLRRLIGSCIYIYTYIYTYLYMEICLFAYVFAYLSIYFIIYVKTSSFRPGHS